MIPGNESCRVITHPTNLPANESAMPTLIEAVPNFSLKARCPGRRRRNGRRSGRQACCSMRAAAMPTTTAASSPVTGAPGRRAGGDCSAPSPRRPSTSISSSIAANTRASAPLDVVPLVPIEGITLDECVALAQQRVRASAHQQLPVYLYAAAASAPERRRLPDIRPTSSRRWWRASIQPERAPTSARRRWDRRAVVVSAAVSRGVQHLPGQRR